MKQEKWISCKNICMITFLVLFWANVCFAQNTVVKGTVIDASTLRPLSFVNVYFVGGKGVMTGEDGSYSIETQKNNLKTLIFSYIGYKNVSKEILPQQQQILNIELEPGGQLSEVVVKTKRRGKYSNRNNPAVELIDLVIENKSKNRITSYDFVQYQQYEKMALSLTNKPEKMMKKRLYRNYKFVLENVDTTTLLGKSLLPIYISEKLSERYFRKFPHRDKTVFLGEKKVNYGNFLDNNGINQYLNMLYADINIYDNNIHILASQFLSPIADMGPTFYRYYIRDTVELNDTKLIRLYFTPKNPNDLIFRGTMFITLDGNYSLQKIDMTISKNANLNWTKELKINQDFEKTIDGRYHVINSTMIAEFALTKSSSGGILGERTVMLKNLLINKPADDSIYNSKDLVIRENPVGNTDSFWMASRHIPLSNVEAKAYYYIDSLSNMRSFKTMGDIFTFLFSGYIGFGKWELGNTNTFYSFNPIEGFKLKVAGRTTPKFNSNLYFDHYVAYGFKDEKLKYLVGGTYSFNHKSIYSFPLNYLRVSYQYDTKIPGQELIFTQEDNFFLSFKRGNNNRWLYNNYLKIEYTREFGKNISYSFVFKNWKQTPAGDIVYMKTSDNTLIPNITTSEISAELRWAPSEHFYQGKNYRIPIINKYPVLKFRYIHGIKGLMNGEYNYENITFRVDKRFYLSQLGYLDATLEGGYIFGKLPFPLLTIHRANQTYAYQVNSYNLMNFMEFVSDRFLASNIDFYFNGFFLNKIPFLKKLKLREVASYKILYGGVRNENDPAKNNKLLVFPEDNEGQQTTFSFKNTPYIEWSIGLAKIFKLIRVDFVHRATYLTNPNISKSGIRTKIRFDF